MKNGYIPPIVLLLIAGLIYANNMRPSDMKMQEQQSEAAKPRIEPETSNPLQPFKSWLAGIMLDRCLASSENKWKQDIKNPRNGINWIEDIGKEKTKRDSICLRKHSH